MAQPLVYPPPGFEDLPVEEQIEYVQALWDGIVDKQQVPVPDWHRDIVRERLANPAPGPSRPWHEVRAELARKHANDR
jgi:hypothetical protein